MGKPKRSAKIPAKEPVRHKSAATEPSYAEASTRVEEILHKIEEGDLDVDEISGLVKEAAELVSLCRQKIHAAEVQVKKIAEDLERDTPDTVDIEEDDE